MTKKTFTGNPEDMYSRDGSEYMSNEMFVGFAKRFGITEKLFWPNYEAAPWHLQIQHFDRLINFWPHKQKAHVADESKVAYHMEEIEEMMFRVQGEWFESDDFDVVEDTQ